jgi:hypothetical protein
VNAFQIGEENAHAVDAVGDRLVRRSAQPGCDVGGQNDGQQRFGAGGLTFQVALGTLQQQKRIDDQDRDNQNRIDHRLKRDIGLDDNDAGRVAWTRPDGGVGCKRRLDRKEQQEQDPEYDHALRACHPHNPNPSAKDRACR